MWLDIHTFTHFIKAIKSLFFQCISSTAKRICCISYLNLFESSRQFWNLPSEWIDLCWLEVLWSELLSCVESVVYLCDTLFKQKNTKSGFIWYVTLKSHGFIWSHGLQARWAFCFIINKKSLIAGCCAQKKKYFTI